MAQDILVVNNYGQIVDRSIKFGSNGHSYWYGTVGATGPTYGAAGQVLICNISTVNYATITNSGIWCTVATGATGPTNLKENSFYLKRIDAPKYMPTIIGSFFNQ